MWRLVTPCDSMRNSLRQGWRLWQRWTSLSQVFVNGGLATAFTCRGLQAGDEGLSMNPGHVYLVVGLSLCFFCDCSFLTQGPGWYFITSKYYGIIGLRVFRYACVGLQTAGGRSIIDTISGLDLLLCDVSLCDKSNQVGLQPNCRDRPQPGGQHVSGLWSEAAEVWLLLQMLCSTAAGSQIAQPILVFSLRLTRWFMYFGLPRAPVVIMCWFKSKLDLASAGLFLAAFIVDKRQMPGCCWDQQL